MEGESNIKGEMISIPDFGEDELVYELEKCAKELLEKVGKVEEKVSIEIGPPIG